MFLQRIKRLIFKTNLGLLPLKEDSRDLGFWSIFGSDYEPKYVKKELKPLSTKNQYKNTCGWASSAGAKEIDEKTELDERFLVIMGKKKGYISGDGFSNLRENEKILKEYGCCEEGLLPFRWNNWNDYSNYKHITQEILNNAAKHKTKSYLRAYSLGEVYKAIDKERPVRIGIDWRTSMNMSGGFSFPWLINFIKGYFVGGHAVYVFGYNTNYRAVRVFKIKNSFGEKYGENGNLYIKEKDLEKCVKKYGAFVNHDMGVDMAKWLIEHQGKAVKGKNPDVFLVQGDKKRKYTDEATLIAHGKTISDIINVQDEYLNKIKRGSDILFWEGGNVKQIKEMILRKDDLKPLFKKYFTELL